MPSTNKTTHLKLNNWEGTDNVQKADFVADNVAIDKAYKELKDRMGNISLVDSEVAITDNKNKFIAIKLDGVLNEIDDKIIATSNKVDNIELTASKVSYVDTTTQLGATNVQQAIEQIARDINGTVSVLNTANNSLEADVGNPV